ncbi:hypothetical protein [Streptomyces syringium]|uniref:hypothetical protein n=1 Tax=Streptomyces syringium TaxID=76729 RepID=UPI003455094C
MNTLSPEIGFVLTTSPPEACAGQKTKVMIDLRLHNRPVSRISIALPVGTGSQHLVAAADTGLIQTILATDYQFTPSTLAPFVPSSKEPFWTIGDGTKSDDNFIFTLTPTHTEHATDHLHLELVDVHLNSTAGSTALTLTTYIGETPTVTSATLKKIAPGLKLENFQAVGRATAEKKEGAPVTQVWNGKPLRLTWTAQDVKELTLKKGADAPVRLRPDQRSYPDSLDPDATPLTLNTDTKFTISAIGNSNGAQQATQEIYLTVYQADGEYSDLTVTGDLKIPEKKMSEPSIYPIKGGGNFTLTAPGDGYYSLYFSTCRRFLRVFPPVLDRKSTALFNVKVSGPAVNSSFDAGNGIDAPLVLFAPAGTTVTLTAPRLPLVDYFSEIPTAVVTWAGSQPEKALPAPTALHEALPMHPKVTLCVARDSYGSDVTGVKWPFASRDATFMGKNGEEITRTSDWWMAGSVRSLQEFGGVAWLPNETTVKAFVGYRAYHGSNEYPLEIKDTRGVTGVALEMLKPATPEAPWYPIDDKKIVFHWREVVDDQGVYAGDKHMLEYSDAYDKASPEEEKPIYSVGVSYDDNRKIERTRKCAMVYHVEAAIKGGEVMWRGNGETNGYVGTQDAWLELKNFNGAEVSANRTTSVTPLPSTGSSFKIPGVGNVVVTPDAVKVDDIKVDWEGEGRISIYPGWTVTKDGIWHDGTKMN